MSTNFWQEDLRQALNRLLLRNPSTRVGIIGVGHELRGDDSIGAYILRRLASSIQENEAVLMIDAGPAPENCTGLLRRFAPHLVIFIDAAEMEADPGAICWIPWQDSTGFSASTHSLPLHVFGNYLAHELKCEIFLLGIQPLDTRMDVALSPVVRDAAEDVIASMIALLSVLLNPSSSHKTGLKYAAALA